MSLNNQQSTGEDAISYEIGICHLFSGLKVDIHCEGKPVR